MIPHFKALNESDDSDDGYDSTQACSDGSSVEEDAAPPTAEAVENDALELYNTAIGLMVDEKRYAAIDLLQTLIAHKLFTGDSRVHGSSASQSLRFAALKNLASLMASKGDHAKAVELYTEAVQLVQDDVSVWYNFGTEALMCHDYPLARRAYYEGLKVSPDHWECTDRLVSLLFILRDYPSCLVLVARAMERRPDYVRGCVLRHEVGRLNPYLGSITEHLFRKTPCCCDEATVSEILTPLRKISAAYHKVEEMILEDVPIVGETSTLTMAAFGRCLCATYTSAEQEGLNMARPLNVDSWISASASASTDVKVCNLPVDHQYIRNIQLSSPAVDQPPPSLPPQPPPPLDTNDGDKATDQGPSLGAACSTTATSTCNSVASGDHIQPAVSCGISEATTIVADHRREAGTPSPSKRRTLEVRRKSDNKETPPSNVFKRRSARLIPGFRLEDPDAFGPLTTKRVPLKDKLLLFVSHDSDAAGNRSSDSVRSCGSESCSEVEGDDETARINRRTCNGESDRRRRTLVPAEAIGDPTIDACLPSFLDTINGRSLSYALQDFLILVSRYERTRWSAELKRVFLDGYKAWSRDVDFITPNDSDYSIDLIESLAFVHMTYAELTDAEASADSCSEENNVAACNRFSETAAASNASAGYLSPLLHYLSVIYALEKRFQSRQLAIRIAYLFGTVNERLNRLESALLWYEDCEQLLLGSSPDREVLLANTSDETVISVQSVRRKHKSVVIQCRLKRVDDMIERDELAQAVALLEDSLQHTDSRSYVQRYRHQLLLAACYQRMVEVHKAAGLLVDLLANAVKVYRCSDVSDKFRVWPDIDTSLAFADWLFHRYDCSRMPADAQRTVSEALVRLVCFLDEYPFSKRDIPDRCWTMPWILLYVLVKQRELAKLRQGMHDTVEIAGVPQTQMVTNCLQILKTAHDFLGGKNFCTANNGQLLLFFSDEILKTLRDSTVSVLASPSRVSETLSCAEQCFFCLYRYPTKKKRHLEEHFVRPIELTWERAISLFCFVCPEKLPACDEPAYNTISADAVQLLFRIAQMVPETMRPEKLLGKLHRFMRGELDEYPESMLSDEPIVNELCHLIADHYLKSRYFDKAIKYYEMDLCLFPLRFDSWAGLGLAASGLLDIKLISLQLSYNDEDKAYVDELTQKSMFSFDQAMKISSSNGVLWLEYGSLAYQLHSFYSRFLKKNRGLGSAERRQISTKIVRLLKTARNAFAQAERLTRSSDRKEDWLIYYMFGKIGEKFDEPLCSCLRNYYKAAYCLFADGARYPEKIRYNNPQRYALESLEVFYRFHLRIVKEMQRRQLDGDELRAVWRYVTVFNGHLFYTTDVLYRTDQDYYMRPLHARIINDPDVVDVVDDVVTTLERQELSCYRWTAAGLQEPVPEEVKYLVRSLVDKVAAETAIETRVKICSICRQAMVVCIQRFPNHYKSYYWLAKIYFLMEDPQHLRTSAEILWGPIRSCGVSISSALFEYRKPNNLFENIWRFPVDDISRSGSFPEHMYRSVKLLIAVLSKRGDDQTLYDLIVALRRKPELEKTYLLENDRKEMLELAQDAVQSAIIKKFNQSTTRTDRTHIFYRSYQRYLVFQRIPLLNLGTWKKMMISMYKEMSGRQDVDFTDALCFAQRLVDDPELLTPLSQSFDSTLKQQQHKTKPTKAARAVASPGDQPKSKKMRIGEPSVPSSSTSSSSSSSRTVGRVDVSSDHLVQNVANLASYLDSGASMLVIQRMLQHYGGEQSNRFSMDSTS